MAGDLLKNDIKKEQAESKEKQNSVTTPASPEPDDEGEDRDTEWKRGKHKSDTKWENQIKDRGWTDEKITDTIKNGDEFPAPNKVNPSNGATRYQTKDGRFVVRDNKTKEILQISGDGFRPNTIEQCSEKK